MLRFVANIVSFTTTGAIFAIGAMMAVVSMYDDNLPSGERLTEYRPPLITRVYSGEGRVIAEFIPRVDICEEEHPGDAAAVAACKAKHGQSHFRVERRVFVPFDEIPPLVVNAFISAEDKNFWDHPGVDAVGIAKAFGRYAMAKASGGGARLSGASTITQQVMKNFLVGDERSVERKVKEAILAVRMEGVLSKERLLELYLNKIYLGQDAYGIVAAANNYFGKSLEELTTEEAAYLAALPKAPSDLHPIKNRDRAVARRNYVIEEMFQNGYLPLEEASRARSAPLDTIVDDPDGPALAKADPTYFTGEIRRQLIRELGKETLYEGGLTVRATIDPELQRIAARALRRGLEKYDRAQGVYLGPLRTIDDLGDGADWQKILRRTNAPRDIEGWSPAVVLAVDGDGATIGVDGFDGDGPAGPGTARLSIAAERKWIRQAVRGDSKTRVRRSEDLWAVGDLILVRAEEGGGFSLRQIPEVQGAFMAMDPFTGRVLAMQGGFSYEHSVFNRATQALRQPGSSFKPFIYAAALDAGYTPATIVLDAPVVVRAGGAPWKPQNSSGRFYGPSPMRVGLEQSRNLMTVRIAQQIGMDRVALYAEKFGVYQNMPHHLSYALGAGETTLFKMVAAYGMFANGGKRVVPTLVDRVQDRFGETLYRHDPRACQGCTVEAYRPDREPLLFDARSQIMDPVTAYQLVSMMQGVVTRGTASRTVGGLPYPIAGKTGTTNDSKDVWFIGFSTNLVAGCFIGFDDPRPMGRGAYGGTVCGPVFREFMAEALELRGGAGKFREPHYGSEMITVKIDRITGERLPDDATGPNVIVEVFHRGTEPELYASVGALAGDAELFGGFGGGDLPYSLGAEEEFEGGSLSGATGEDPVGGAGGPSRPKPPTSVGIGTGGLY